jgi:hypothetical protein
MGKGKGKKGITILIITTLEGRKRRFQVVELKRLSH